MSLFSRKKNTMPEPQFQDNWKQDRFEQNIQEGITALEKGLPVIIYEDGRGFELASEIKRGFILEYQKQLSEKIKITNNGSTLTVKI